MDQMLTNLTVIWNQHWIILAIGPVVALLAFVIGRQVLRVGDKNPETKAPQDLPEVDLSSTRDRRSEPRREGNSVAVELTDPKGEGAVIIGWVLDRSRGGIGLHVPVDIPLGTILNAKPRVRENSYTVPLEVRSSRPTKDGFALGCQFLQMPPWNVLLLFG
jgi:hypothetical protein